MLWYKTPRPSQFRPVLISIDQVNRDSECRMTVIKSSDVIVRSDFLCDHSLPVFLAVIMIMVMCTSLSWRQYSWYGGQYEFTYCQICSRMRGHIANYMYHHSSSVEDYMGAGGSGNPPIYYVDHFLSGSGNPPIYRYRWIIFRWILKSTYFCG